MKNKINCKIMRNLILKEAVTPYFDLGRNVSVYHKETQNIT